MMRIFTILIILIAVVVGVSAFALNRDQIDYVIYFRQFFEITIPILGFGALVKYLCYGNKCCSGCACCKK